MGVMVSPEVLRRYPFFAGLDHETLCEIAKLSEIVEVEKDAWIFHAEDIARYFYFVMDGEVELLVKLGSQIIERIPVTRLIRGELFGWSALVEPHIYQLDARPRQTTRLVRLPGVDMCELLTHRPDLGCLLLGRITRIIGDRLNELRLQFVSLIDGGRWQHFSARRDQYMHDGGLAKPREEKFK